MKTTRFSRIGFILAASGSAVGLGNIWKFPYITGEYGGGAFVLIYLVAIAFVGVSVLMAEMIIGRLGRADCVSSFETLAPKYKSLWKYAGFSAFTGLLILTFYNVVIGWILYYIINISFSLPTTIAQSETIFNNLLKVDITSQILYFSTVTILIGLIVYRGIKGGIEKFNIVFFPIIIVIFLGMLFYAMSMDSFSKSVSFLFNPDFSKITTEAIMVSVGHAFFTLSIGMGAIMSYASSLQKDTNIFQTSIIIAFIDTAIALIAGLVLFTFLFEYGASPAKGPGLVFISLPTIFAELGLSGSIFALFFFVALAFAGLTSAISLLEPSVQYFIDRFNYSRARSTLINILLLYIVGIMVLLSSTNEYADIFKVGNKSLFDSIDFLTSAILLPFTGFVMAIFVSTILPRTKVIALLKESMSDRAFSLWIFSLKYIAPLAIIFVILKEVGVLNFN